MSPCETAQRPLEHFLRYRRVLNQLDQIVAEDHLARCRGDVHADLEIARVRLTDFQLAAARLDILRQHGHAAHEIGASLAQGLTDQFRVGQEEVGRRERTGELLEVELRLVPRALVEPVRILHEVFRPTGGDEIGLFQEIEDRVLRPFRVLEAVVLGLRLRHRFGGFTLRTFQGRSPERQELRSEAGLGLKALLRVAHPGFGHAAEGSDGFRGIA